MIPDVNSPPMTRTTRAGRAICGQNKVSITHLVSQGTYQMSTVDDQERRLIGESVQNLTLTDSVAQELFSVGSLQLTLADLLDGRHISIDKKQLVRATEDLVYFFHQWGPMNGYGMQVMDLIDSVRFEGGDS